MREMLGSDGSITTLTDFGPGLELPVFQQGIRLKGDIFEQFTIASFYHDFLPGGRIRTEYETIATRPVSGQKLFQFEKYVLRCSLYQPVRLPLSLKNGDPASDFMVDAHLTDFGFTILGGPEGNPSMPWAHFRIDQVTELEKAFGHLRHEDRRPSNRGGMYITLKVPDDAPKSASLMLPHTMNVLGRDMTFTRARVISIDYNPDRPGGVIGEALWATVQKVYWVWGDPNRPLGMMA